MSRFYAGRRALNLYGALACAALLAYALYAERVLGLPPCPLCIFQRLGIAAVGVLFLLGVALPPSRRAAAYVYTFALALAALATAAVAARHVYIQTLPPGTVPSCGAPLEVMLQFSPWFEVVRTVLTASGECGTVDWTLIGLTMPGWVLVCALALGAYGVWVNVRRAADGRRPTADG